MGPRVTDPGMGGGGHLSSVRALCMSLPGVSERKTHGAPTWFVNNRRSLAKFVDPALHRGAETCPAIWAAAAPGVRHELVAEAPDRFFEPPFGGSDWIGLRLCGDHDAIDWDEVGEVLQDAFRHVAPAYLVRRMASRS